MFRASSFARRVWFGGSQILRPRLQMRRHFSEEAPRPEFKPKDSKASESNGPKTPESEIPPTAKPRENPRPRENQNEPNRLPGPNFWALGILVGGALLGTSVMHQADSIGRPEITFREFQNTYLAGGHVQGIRVVNNATAYIDLKPDSPLAGAGMPQLNIGSVKVFKQKLDDAQDILGVPPAQFVPVRYEYPPDPSKLFGLVPTLILLYLVVRMYRGFGNAGGIDRLFQTGKSQARMFNKTDKVPVTFADVAGLPEAKQEIQEFVDFFKNPERYKSLGARIPKGALLVGPPGTGKTLLAKAVAGEADVPFFSTSGADFVEMFVGVGSSRVRNLFAEARSKAPCIIFIDEIDAIGRARGRSGFGGSDERENTLNALLVEMDGFTPSSGIIVLAGTNRADILDKALTRAGRFDRQIALDNPDLKSREEIFNVHLKKVTLKEPQAESRQELSKLAAKLTPGFSGAEIAGSCNEAALHAAAENKEFVSLVDLEVAIDRQIGGLEKKSKVLSPEEKKIVAYHEAGHALVGWFLEYANPLLKVSIIPRGTAALGFSQYLPKDQYLLSQEQMRDQLATLLGGRMAEEVQFGSITTGASDDLAKVTRLAYALVNRYGMTDVGPLSYRSLDETGQVVRQYSDATAEMMDLEVRRIVEEAGNRARGLVQQHKAGLESLALVLMEKEVINRQQVEDILGKRPFADVDEPPTAEMAM